MLGHSRSGGADDRVSEWELMRIELDAQNGEGPRIRMGFFAAPQGRGWTTFAWSPDPARGVSFFNAANDYPQHIRYWREGKLLNAEISSLNGDNAKRWSFAPAPR